MEMKVETAEAWETSTAGEVKAVELRASVVESCLAGLRAAQLSLDEYVALAGAIHAIVGAGIAKGIQPPTLVVQATALERNRVTSRSVAIECPVPLLASVTVEQLVRHASPELWGQMRAVLEMTDAELAEELADAAYWAP